MDISHMKTDYKFSPKHLNSPTARKAIPVRKKPYRLSLTRGITLLYRRNEGPGTWSVEVASGDGKPWQKKFAMADDVETANGRDVMTLDQAKEHARKLARADDGPTDGDRPATVKEALEDYKKHLESRGQGTTHASGLIKRLPNSLAAKPVAMMTVKDCEDFREAIGVGVKNNTCDRHWKIFKAAMNRAQKADKRIRDRPWCLEALPDDTEANNVILTDKEVNAIVAEAHKQDAAFGLLVEVLAVTGTRICQARRLTVGELLPGNRLNMPTSKKGRGKKVSHAVVPITPVLAERLRAVAGEFRSENGTGRTDNDLLLTDGGFPWGKDCQREPFRAVVKAIGLETKDGRKVTSYALRHSSIVRMLLRNVPIRLVAAHHDTGVIYAERHYSKHIAAHAEDVTRAALLAA